MIKFELDGQKYQTPEGWHEVTFERFMDYLSNISTQEPEELKEFIHAHQEFIGEIKEETPEKEVLQLASSHFESSWKRLGAKKQNKCHEFYAIEVGFWCGLDAEVIRSSMDIDILEQAFWAIQITLKLNNQKEDIEFVGFECKGKEYLLPSKHMEGATVAEFAEAAQFEENVEDVVGGNWDAMLDVVVVLCRPKGEVYSYNENQHKMRKKQFKKLTMDKIINIAFFLLRQNDILKSNLLIYSLSEQVEQKQLEKLVTFMDGH